MILLQVLAIFLLHNTLLVDGTLEEAKQFIRVDFHNIMTKRCSEVSASRLAFQTDLMNEAKREQYADNFVNTHATHDTYLKKLKEIVVPFIIDDKFFKEEHSMAMEELPSGEDFRKLVETQIKADVHYNTARVCPYDNKHCNLKTEGLHITEIEDVMAVSRDYDELLYFWTEWRKATAGLKELVAILYKSENETAQANNFSTVAEYNQHFFHNHDTLGYTLKLWNEMEPLYLELHKYVSRKLKKFYGDKLDISDGMLPAHILGNMWAESWYNIEPLVRPFPNVSDGNLEENMKKRFSVQDLFRMADEFYQSMGMLPMKASYEAPNDMVTLPTDGREVACYPSSADFCNGTTRVIMCAKVNLEHMINIYHELGHIQYFMQYNNLSIFLRDSAGSPALHETIGETVALSATAPRHLKKLELLTDYNDTYESSINYLMKMALIKVAFMPVGMIVDMWKWEVSSNKVPVDQWNARWWNYRTKYQRVKPPVPRSDATDFDPASKYHVALNGAFMPYYHAHFMQFQIYKGLCMKAREYDPALYKICPLHDCDLYNSKVAGEELADALKSGTLEPWTTVLENLSGSPNISSEPMLEYFQPLYEFLVKENKKADEEEALASKPIIHHHTLATILSIAILIVVGVVIYIYRKKIRCFRLYFQ